MKAENIISKTCHSVLIVEDDEAIRTILKEILENEGYEVFTAENGKVGIEILQKIARPCLILLDFLMPVMNGKEFMEAKRQDDLIAPIPVVLVSAFEDRSKDIGAQGFVKKPIDFDCLLRFLGKYCHRKNEAGNTL